VQGVADNIKVCHRNSHIFYKRHFVYNYYKFQ